MKRLNKFIADTGYCSRREADGYIAQGRVTINGQEAGLGSMVEAEDKVEVDGDKVSMKRVGGELKRATYIAFNKPEGVTCTTDLSDETNIISFIGHKERIFPVGRLDKDSQGLIILTNDGDIVNKILRAGNEHPKEYVVTVDKPITVDFLKQMGDGVRILRVKTKKCKVVRQNDTTFTIHLTQGLNRQIRRMCQVLGYKVVKLKRTRVLNLKLGDLRQGMWRDLTLDEISKMQELLASSSGTQAPDKGRPKSKGGYADYRKKESVKVGKKPVVKK